MSFSAAYFDLSGRQLSSGEFSLLTKSIDTAIEDAIALSGFDVVSSSTSFAVLGQGNKRLVVGKAEACQ
ncbi:hypothetical protein [Vibrio sp. EJY3]|uniref:hypothetical protein n=1 Tax=Vibrio sp. (strain EJY3) TaxID=1116375 RepID=UPI000243B2E8|nr:hypothetical protein [Vibrio sp. EJY3]AEX22451.1 hypothetical protein VEJY3_09855 [Vibrio sp. EJY3]